MPGYSGTSTATNNGLYRPCHFYRGVSFRDQATWLSADSGWTYHWDPIAQAPWSYNARKATDGLI